MKPSQRSSNRIIDQLAAAMIQNRPFDAVLASSTVASPWTHQLVSNILRSIPRFFFMSPRSIGRQKGFRHRSPLKQRNLREESARRRLEVLVLGPGAYIDPKKVSLGLHKATEFFFWIETQFGFEHNEITCREMSCLFAKGNDFKGLWDFLRQVSRRENGGSVVTTSSITCLMKCLGEEGFVKEALATFYRMKKLFRTLQKQQQHLAPDPKISVIDVASAWIFDWLNTGSGFEKDEFVLDHLRKTFEYRNKAFIAVSFSNSDSNWEEVVKEKEKKMMKNVNKATPVYATSETLVWWDMDSCPLPNGYDPSRLGPRIDTELKNLGYNGPLTIIAVGNLDGIPYEFLKVLSSNGFAIKHSGQDIHGDMREYFISRSRLCQPPPVTIMIISGVPLLLESVTREIYVRPDCGYNLLLAYPPHSEPKQPHPSSFVRFGGEWLWDRASLLKGSSNEEKRRLDKGSVIPFSCGLCYFFCPSFEDFTSHLQSAKHARKVEVDNGGRDTRFKLALKELEAAKLSEASFFLVKTILL
ncbi:hypothetical protein HID58_001718 [Brassica napus]|uniref:NYN domain-containing protein n=1 Tax=Brassica napus TaxID=3708 RepID=A0ABQ8EN74_BRANA|nr:hypothetical protein HID58_001718 [Brassica napus]